MSQSSDLDPLVERLDLMVGVLQLAFEEEIAAARNAIRADPTNSAILDACVDGYVPSGVLQRELSKELGVSERTIRVRLAQLEGRRILRQEGSGRNTQYRSTGLV